MNENFQDGMMSYLNNSAEQFITGGHNKQLKKTAAQSILELELYMKSHYAEYLNDVSLSEMQAYFTDEELDIIGQIANYDSDLALSELSEMLIRRVRKSKFIRPREISGKVPAIITFLKGRMDTGGHRLEY